MGKFDGILLVSDFDDTLYDWTFQVPERNVKAIEYFIREGGYFTVATGRAKRTFAPYAHLVPFNAPVILSNGSAIYDFQREEMLVQTMLDDRVAEDFRALTDVMPSLAFEAYHKEEIYVHNCNAVTLGHMKKVATGHTDCSIDEMPLPWTKAILQEEHEVLLQAREWLQTNCPNRYEAIFSNRYYLEVTNLGSTKGGMVKKLAEMLDISPMHIYCVGDNQNDIPMLELSDIPFAPSSCADEVRDWGAKIMCHCNDGVIGDIVELLDQMY